jgi:hypothetical protein
MPPQAVVGRDPAAHSAAVEILVPVVTGFVFRRTPIVSVHGQRLVMTDR